MNSFISTVICIYNDIFNYVYGSNRLLQEVDYINTKAWCVYKFSSFQFSNEFIRYHYPLNKHNNGSYLVKTSNSFGDKIYYLVPSKKLIEISANCENDSDFVNELHKEYKFGIGVSDMTELLSHSKSRIFINKEDRTHIFANLKKNKSYSNLCDKIARTILKADEKDSVTIQ